MAKLEEIVVDSKVLGILPSQTVEIQSVRWRGSGVLDITYKDQSGNYNGTLLYRDDEARLELQSAALPWSFDADGEKLKLYSEANRIHLAHLFDPYLAVHTSSVEPLPHQISVVYEEMLSRLPLCYILALVEVDGTDTKTTYLKEPFHTRPDFTMTSVNYDINDLIENAIIVLQDR